MTHFFRALRVFVALLYRLLDFIKSIVARRSREVKFSDRFHSARRQIRAYTRAWGATWLCGRGRRSRRRRQCGRRYLRDLLFRFGLGLFERLWLSFRFRLFYGFFRGFWLLHGLWFFYRFRRRGRFWRFGLRRRRSDDRFRRRRSGRRRRRRSWRSGCRRERSYWRRKGI